MPPLSLNLLAEIGGWPVLKEARVLVEQGRVLESRQEGATVRARVQGGEKIYEPQLILAEKLSDIQVRCTCLSFKKSGQVCAHALAAGVALLAPPKKPASIRTPVPVQGETAASEPSRFSVKLEGTLSGLTLELFAHYGEKIVPLRESLRPVEKNALEEIARAGFKPVGRGSSQFALAQEKAVAHFLANTLAHWEKKWSIAQGPRLENTCREIDLAVPEFSWKRGSGQDWLGLDLQLTVGSQPIDLAPAEIQRWLQTGQSHLRTARNRTLLIPTEAWGEINEALAESQVRQENGQLRVAPTAVPFLGEVLAAQGFHARTAPLAEKLPAVEQELAPELWALLRPYQRQGVAWLTGQAQKKFPALLADDMGLGKTLQALAFCSWWRQREPGPMLIVCPTSLVINWQREATRFVPHLRVLEVTGTGAQRKEKWARRGDHDLLITSYAILRRDLKAYREIDFALVLLDEAQHIKNRSSQNAQSAYALRARQRLILTGTPLENSVLDLWSLFQFLLPGYLGSARDFQERYETPLTQQAPPRLRERLRLKVRPFFLRRTKEEVLTELPPKLEHLTLCELSAEQREVYRALLEQGRREAFDESGKATRNRLAVLTTLLRLRQASCHLDLLPAGDKPRSWQEPSAKMERTFELIDEAIDGGHRVLLFSQFVQALHLLRAEAARREIRFCYLDGETRDRQAEIDRFQQEAAIPLFFISLKAGGTGLNLTGADTVIHFDPWWNPAVEEQATARAHRLGQTRVVQAYKLIAAGTVEEKIQALQARKKELFAASVTSDEAFAESLTGEELAELLTDVAS